MNIKSTGMWTVSAGTG